MDKNRPIQHTNIKHDTILRLVKLLDVVCITLPFAAAWLLYYGQRIAAPYYAKGNYLMIALFALLFVLYSRVYDGFLMSMNPVSEMIYSQGLAAFIADFILYGVTWLLTRYLPNPLPLLLAYVAQLLLAALWCGCARAWYFKSFEPKKTVVIYDRRRPVDEMIRRYGLSDKFRVIRVISEKECMEGGLAALDEAEAVFLSGVGGHSRNEILKDCVARNVTVYMLPRIGDMIMRSAKPMHMFHQSVLRVDRYRPSPEFIAVKRAFDIVASLAGIIVFSPVMIVVALAIKLTDGGPALYKQKRLTKNGQVFSVLKFRSMRVDAEKDGVARLSTGDKDDRITPVGRFIRKVRLDELPQLFNILRGDMSVVGPRPERPEIAAQYMETLPEFALRLQAKAGLTGLAQVYGKYNTDPYEKLQMDLLYISNPSILEDMRIIFATIKILFLPESTEGVAEGQATAMAEVSSAGETPGAAGTEDAAAGETPATAGTEDAAAGEIEPSEAAPAEIESPLKEEDL